MTQRPKGGRGHKAPYETCTVRVPKLLRDKIDAIIDEFVAKAVAGEDAAEADTDLLAVDYGKSIENAKIVLRAKESALKSIIKLLQLNYGKNKADIEKDLKST